MIDVVRIKGNGTVWQSKRRARGAAGPGRNRSPSPVWIKVYLGALPPRPVRTWHAEVEEHGGATAGHKGPVIKTATSEPPLSEVPTRNKAQTNYTYGKESRERGTNLVARTRAKRPNESRFNNNSFKGIVGDTVVNVGRVVVGHSP